MAGAQEGKHYRELAANPQPRKEELSKGTQTGRSLAVKGDGRAAISGGVKHSGEVGAQHTGTHIENHMHN